MSGPGWQISAGELFEFLRPAAWAFSTLLSACVLADTQGRRLPLYSMAAWTIATLLIPLVTLPIYLIARFALHTRAGPTPIAPTLIGPAPVGPSRGYRILLPLVYTLLVLSLLALYFHHEYSSVDAHLARANQARLLNQRERTIGEYRAALRLEDDAHTHNLLATELAYAELWEDALSELRAAERGGEPDETIPYRIAYALDVLDRRAEAAREYQSFLHTHLCTQEFPDARCENARLRLQAAQ